MDVSEDLIQGVWEKARATQNRDPTQWRKDQCGAWLQREHYNNAHSEYGWKLEKVVPGGPDITESFQPFQWNNGFDLESGRAQCRVTADREDVLASHRVEPPRNTRHSKA